MHRRFIIVQRHVFDVEIKNYTGEEATVLEQLLYEGNTPIAALKSQSHPATCIDCEVNVFDEQVCRCCGCTNDVACIHNEYETCHWVADDLCSACIGVEDAPDLPFPFDITSPASGAQNQS